jgi:hypothetical protein
MATKKIINDRQRARRVYGFIQRVPDKVTVASLAAEGDGNVLSLDWKESVKYASTTNISPFPPLPANILNAIDGSSLVNGDRILIKDQTTTSENGIYVVDVAGLTWKRADDAIPGTKLTCGASVYVDDGTENSGTKWTVTNPNIVLGGPITWEPFNYWLSHAGELLTTYPTSIGGDVPSQIGPDVFFYVSGSRASLGATMPNVELSVFGGDVLISGTLDLVRGDGIFGNLLEVTGSVIATYGLSGSLTQLHNGNSYLVAGSNITIVSQSNGQVTVSSLGGSPGGSDREIQYNDLGTFSASVNLRFSSTNVLEVTGALGVEGNALPSTDNIYNLGSADKRWANIYTGDLHLRNDKGDWTLIEDENDLLLRNNKTSQFFKFMLQPVEKPNE